MTQAENLILIHYHEVGLKGKNRGRFENQLISNVNKTLKDIGIGPIRRISGRIYVELTPASPVGVIRERLGWVFGIANYSEALRVDNEIEQIRQAAWAAAQKTTFGSFKIATRRSDKTFPFNSDDINRDVGAYVQERSQADVRMTDPDLTCFIEVTTSGTFVYAEKFPGPGGLPVGSNEKAVSLISSGIDSPVASYKIMKRGVTLSFVHFHSQPYTNRNSERNVEKLVKHLIRHQFKAKLYSVPFVEIQRHIMQHGIEGYRVILYRRAMLRIAEAVARRERAHCLVTGDNVGQVASQTLMNLKAIEDVTLYPVLRPLAGDNKDEIVEQAKKIGTYEISIEPYEDACTVFIPKHPTTRAKLDDIHKTEAEMDLDALIDQTLAQTVVKVIER
ncbi:TPA: tRNA 4-thiouridine(8) synthase ThiI [Candidatus Latescibacteria bacterium]|nr:tRNA 4-thiouridine(8) synthase ThiI [Candidatus Latescibacterota bacterium]